MIWKLKEKLVPWVFFHIFCVIKLENEINESVWWLDNGNKKNVGLEASSIFPQHPFTLPPNFTEQLKISIKGY